MSAVLLQRRKVLFASPLLVLPAGCSLLPTPEAAQIYRLSPEVYDPPGPPIARSALAIDLPVASESLDSDRIALTQGRTRFDYYADSVWTDRLPILLQTLMVDAFERDGRISAVSRDNDGPGRGYLLRTEIRRFEAEYPSPPTGPPEIAVDLELHLSSDPQNRLLGTKLISERTRASRNQIDAIIIAFDVATGSALTQCIAWTVGVIGGGRAHSRRA
jgi:cholesterol transport system auxiliary component